MSALNENSWIIISQAPRLKCFYNKTLDLFDTAVNHWIGGMLESSSIMRSRAPARRWCLSIASVAWHWFDRGYVSPLRRNSIHLVDARGRGDSEQPHDEASDTLDRRQPT